MKFACAFLIVLTCLIPFFVGAGFGLNALLGYCTSNKDCRSYEVCKKNLCTDECAEAVCDDNEYCELTNGIAICNCRPGFSINQYTFKCEQKIYCNNATDCVSPSICRNHTCIDVCKERKCGPFEECEINEKTAIPTCRCKSVYRRHPETMQCVKRCIHNEDCPETQACLNERWCDTPCVGPIPPHSHCVPQNHQPTYQCDRCYRPGKTGDTCVFDTTDDSCIVKKNVRN